MKEDKGPLILLIVFAVFTIVFGVMAYMNFKAIEPEPPAKTPDSIIADIKRSIAELEASAANYREQAVSLRKAIAEQNAIYDFNADLAASYESEYNRRRQLLTRGENFDNQAQELDASLTKLKQETLNSINADISASRDKTEKDLSKSSADKDAALNRLRQLKEEFDTDSKSHRKVKNYTQSSLDEAKSVLSDLTQREVEHADVIYTKTDGKVILSDPVHSTAIINLGTADNVKNGYRFECFVLRPGNRHVTKGYLEVRHADVNSSDCIIVQKPVDLPKDPLSSYIGSQPEEMYSPYQESGKKGFSAQPLSGGVKTVMSGMNPTDPIVEGDLIENPFFSKDKQLIFYIAGSKEIVNERQKSAIRYRWPEIKAVIESYGGKVVFAVDTSVNFMIAQKNAKGDDPEFQKGVEVGIPVIYEWELFRFLDTQ